MDRRQPQHLLKILSGPHEGAEVMLNDGECVLGSSSECDLVLADVLIAPRQLKFEIAGDKIGINSFAEGVSLNGKPIREKKAAVEHFQFISIGTTHLAIGPARGTWPSISLQDFHRELASDRGPASNGLPVAAGALAPAASPDASAPPAANGTATPEETAAPAEEGTAEPEKPPKSGRAGLRIAGLLAVAAIGYWLAHRSAGPSLAQPLPMEPSPTRDVPAMLASLKLADRVHLESKGGRWILTGYVPSEETRYRLQGETARVAPGVQVKVWSDDGLASDARGILERLGLKLEVSSSGSGTLKIKGYVPTKAAWDQAAGFLKTDVLGLAVLDDAGIVTGEGMAPEIHAILAERGLDTALTVTPEPAGIAVTGVLSEELEAPWKSAQAAIVEKLGSPGLLRNGVQVKAMAGAVRQKPLDFRIDSIIAGDGVSWVSVRNGKKYFPGAVLPNGFTVTKIADDGVTLEKDDQKTRLKVGDNLWVKGK